MSKQKILNNIAIVSLLGFILTMSLSAYNEITKIHTRIDRQEKTNSLKVKEEIDKINKRIDKQQEDTIITFRNVNTNIFKQKLLISDIQQKIEAKVKEEIDKINTNFDENIILKTSVIVSNTDNTGFGSGTIIKKDSEYMYILTCEHVVTYKNYNFVKIPYNELKIGYYKDKNKKIELESKVEIVKIDPDHDLALIKINYIDINLRVATIAEHPPIKGDTLYAVGNPLGFMRNISKGILSNKTKYYYVYDGLTTFGNSGGGLFNDKGELVGVPSVVPMYSTTAPESNLGMSINLPTIKEFLKDLL